jgi:hypothetical protein
MAGRTGGRRRRAPVLLALTAGLVVALVAGCGGPSWNYVTNSADRTYLKVPNSWRQVDPAEVSTRLGVPQSTDSSQGVWIAAYDSDERPSLDHVIGQPDAAAPAMLVTVQAIPEASRGGVSLDSIRDFVYPVSDTARQTQALGGGAANLSDFTLLGEQVLTPGDGLRGVHSVFSYRIGGGTPQVFDQTGYLNDDASKLYLTLARCSADCFMKRQSEIENVVTSFTVREGP